MIRDTRLAGVGGLAFGVLVFVALIVANPVGGDYDPVDVADFVARDHRTEVFISLYVMLLAASGLIVLMGYLRDTAVGEGRLGRIFWGMTVAAAAAFVIGWGIALTPSLSLAIGGGQALDPQVAYTFAQAGLITYFFAGGLMMSLALITFAFGASAVPMWVRWASGVAGLLALGSPAFFPFFVLPLWALAVGAWLVLAPQSVVWPNVTLRSRVG